MKNYRILSVFIALALSITLGGCNTDLNSTAAIRTLAWQSSNPPEKRNPAKDSLMQREPVAIMFLIDKSGSVVGVGKGPKCDVTNLESNLPHVGMSYLAKVLSHLPPESSQYIHVGVSQFGNSYRPIIKLAPAHALADSTGMSVLDARFSYTDDGTEYATALRKGYQDLQKYSDQRKIAKQMIVLLTDGLEVSDETESVLAEIPLNVEIHANLVCPDTKSGDTSFWAKHRIRTSRFPNEWLTDFWEHPDIKPVLPAIHGWLDGTSVSETLLIRGDVNQVNFKYWSWQNPDDSHFTIDANIIDENNSPISKTPRQGCVEHEFVLKSRVTDTGFWWAETQIPFIDKITLSSDKLINDSPIEITAHLSGNGFSSGETEKWRDCYKSEDFEFTALNGPAFSMPAIPCEDNGTDVCPKPDGNGLYIRWHWYPPILERSANIPVTVNMNMTDAANNPKSITSEGYSIAVRFKPKKILVTPNFTESNDKELFVDLKFAFDNEKWKPDIYLLRTGQVQNNSTPQSTPRPCPAAKNISGIPNPAYFVQQNTPIRDLFANGSSSWQSTIGAYQLVVNSAVIDECGFAKVLFIWKESSKYQVDETRWTCDLQKFECEE
jgi:hypothetical protein